MMMPGPKQPGAVAPATAFACDPELAALFTPKALEGAYEVCTTPDSLDQVLASARSNAAAHFGPDELVDPLDAFGDGGSYDRSALARLYGGTRARVVHGWQAADGRFESLTLIAPHPDRALSRLDPGTLLIRYRLRAHLTLPANRGL